MSVEAALAAAEEARTALNRAAIDTDEGWERRFAVCERIWLDAEGELKAALSRIGVDVERVISVLA